MTTYPSKILLFGEYTVIKGGAALAIPFETYAAKWVKDGGNSTKAKESLKHLNRILTFVKTLQKPLLDCNKMETDVKNGVWLDSNIPTGYGLGSSGAVSAALYDIYAKKKATSLLQLKEELAAIENCFHGSSSGVDPLVSYTNQAILIKEENRIEAFDISLTSEGEGALFLLDTKLPRHSTPLIEHFVNACKEDLFNTSYIEPIKKQVEEAIEAFISNDHKSLSSAFRKITALQFQYMQPMIPEVIRPLWQRGLDQQEYALKICGAGGGGYMLGICSNYSRVKQDHLSAWDTTPICRFHL